MNRGTSVEYRSKLDIFEDESSIIIRGSVFKYRFDKKSGLIRCLEILGDDFLSGTGSEIPDIYVSDSENPRESFYAAKYEDKAECEVISSNPYQVHIRTHGIYHNPSGDTLPIRYRITYEIQSDGTMFIVIHNKAHDPCILRWLCIAKGIMNPSLCKYFSHLADQSKTDTTDNYTFKALPAQDAIDQSLFNGRLIPWFWFGNDKSGVEISLWDVTNHRYGTTQVSGKMLDPLSEIGANVSCIRQKNGVLWEIYSLRNLKTPIKDGWEQINYFALSITPSRLYSTRIANLQVFREDSGKYVDDYKYLTDAEIADLSRNGYNLIIGGVNWRSGEYIPDNDSELRRVIDTCHKHGIKIIPRLSLMELDENIRIFEEYGPEWRIEPAVEYEYETGLMCPGAEEWREYWKQQIDRITQEYDFDGAFLDFWYDRLACRNPKHGCQRRFMRISFTWLREMLAYAGAKFKGKDENSIIMANTDILPISMICSWLDARVVGASQDIRHINRMTGKAFFNSYRLGCQSLMRVDRVQKIDLQILALSLLYMSPIVITSERSLEEKELIHSYWNVLKFFDISKSTWYPGFSDDPEIKIANTNNIDLYVNIYKNHENHDLLLTVINLSPNEIHGNISITNTSQLGLEDDKKYVIYEPLTGNFLPGRERWTCADMRSINIDIAGHSPKIFYIRQYSHNPSLLYALGANGLIDEVWNENNRELKFNISAPMGGDLSMAVYCPFGRPADVRSHGMKVDFIYDEIQKLTKFDNTSSLHNFTEIILSF